MTDHNQPPSRLSTVDHCFLADELREFLLHTEPWASMSWRQRGQATGIAHPYLLRYSRGEFVPTLDVYHRICASLRVPLGSFLKR